jgi:hypothetical protein
LLRVLSAATGLWTFGSSVVLAASDSVAGGTIDVSWQTLLLGYGPLGVFAIFVGIDKIGNNSERNRLRELNDQKDKHIADLHERIEKDVVPALVKMNVSQEEGSKVLANAVKIMSELYDTHIKPDAPENESE